MKQVHIALGIIWSSDHKQVLISERPINKEFGGFLEFPGGKLEAEETPEQALIRELEEETGTDKASIIAQSKGWYNYDLPEDLIPVIWGGKFRGQRQKWFAMRFTGIDADINIAIDHPEFCPEFCEWQWVHPAELPDLIVPFKRELYKAVVEEFSDIFTL